MATKIQGITIEVGGDTSPLAKAFESVNKVISSTQTELRQVEKALKLNPSSTELLTQKQQLLSEQVKNTSEKISKLKEIEQEVQKRREADPTNKDLAQQLRTVQRELSNTEAGLQKLQTEYKDTEGTLKNLNQTVDDGAGKHRTFKDRLAGVFQGLKDFVTGNHNAAGAVETSATELNSKLEIWDKFSSVVANAAQKLFDFVSGAAQKADDLNTLAKVTGLTTEEIQKLQYSSSFVDVDFDTLSSSLSRLTKGMSDAQRGTGEAKWALDDLRISLIDNHGQMKSNTEVFYEIIDKLGKIENVTKRDSLAMAIFGESAQKLNPLIMAGSEQLRALGIEAENAGIIMSQDTLDGANQLNDILDKLKLTIAGVAAAAGAELAGSMVTFFEAITPLILALAKVIALIGKIPPQALIVIGIIITAVTAFMKVTQAVSAAKGMFEAMNPTMWKTVGIIMAIIAALIALIALIVVLTDKTEDVGKVGEAIERMSSDVGNVDVSGSKIPRYATGTNYHRGGLAFITEYSPEQLSLPNGTNMVVMPRGTKVNPNVSGISSSEAGGGDVFNISINANNVEEFNDIIRLAERARQERRAM